MEPDSLQARIEHGVAELRGAYPRISACRATLEDWYEGAEPRHSLRIEIRWPEHQSLISGPSRASAGWKTACRFASSAKTKCSPSPTTSTSRRLPPGGRDADQGDHPRRHRRGLRVRDPLPAAGIT